MNTYVQSWRWMPTCWAVGHLPPLRQGRLDWACTKFRSRCDASPSLNTISIPSGKHHETHLLFLRDSRNTSAGAFPWRTSNSVSWGWRHAGDTESWPWCLSPENKTIGYVHMYSGRAGHEGYMIAGHLQSMEFELTIPFPVKPNERYVFTAIDRFPLSNRDSNTSVVSSGPLGL